MDASHAVSGPRHIHDIELDNAVPILDVAGARTSGTDATSASHLLRPERASEDSRPSVTTPVSTGEEVSGDDTTSAYHLLQPDHPLKEQKRIRARAGVQDLPNKRAGVPPGFTKSVRSWSASRS
jgi:hypothetical protein